MPTSLLVGALGADSVAARWPTVAMQLAALASLVAGVWRLNEQPLGWAVLEGMSSLAIYTAGVVGLALLT